MAFQENRQKVRFVLSPASLIFTFIPKSLIHFLHCLEANYILQNIFFNMGQPRPFSDYYCNAFYKLSYNRRIDNQLSISAPCSRGLSSRPGLTQQKEGIQSTHAPLLLGYLQAGVVTMAPTAVDKVSR